MPYLSVIVPCYNVQAYLRECLDSILLQPFTDVEVIAVDDASPDHSGEILDEYAARDPRVRVLHLTENVGLGHARNAGLEHASGEYVLFVDSDDWLAPHSLEAISHRLKETHPDVLFFDYARAYWNGVKRRNVVHHLFREPPPPDTFTLKERTSVIYLWQSAWNKAYRREFLLNLGVLFPKGFYEDIPVSYPVMIAAERISMLDRVCYYYRQNRSGRSILSSLDKRHMAIIDQFEAVFEWMDHAGSSVDWFRPIMLRRAIMNELVVFGRRSLLPREHRREFFARVADQFHRRVPDGFDLKRPQRYLPPQMRPQGREPAVFDLVRRRSYRGYLAYQWLKRRRDEVRRLRRQARAAAGRSKRSVARALRRARYRYWLMLPIRPTEAVFAYNRFRAPGGDPLAVYEKMKELAPHFRGVWVVRAAEAKNVPEGLPFVTDGSAGYYRAMARSRYFVNNVDFPTGLRKRAQQIYVQTHDGTPLETTGVDLLHFPAALGSVDLDARVNAADRWDYSLSTNPLATEVWQRVYPSTFQTLEIGRPSNDVLLTSTRDDVTAARAGLGIPEGKRVIWLETTPRGYRREGAHMLDVARLVRSLAPDEILMVRGIPGEFLELRGFEAAGMFVGVAPHAPVQQLCLAADVLITDYSPVIFDFANLARPIISFLPDHQIHREVRGLYVDLPADGPGAVATSEMELMEILRARTYLAPEARARLERFRRRFCPWDDGFSAERVVRTILLGEPAKPPIDVDDRSPAPSVVSFD